MKSILISALTALIVSLVVFYYGASMPESSPRITIAQKESAYDRVMRTGVLKCGYYQWPGIATKNPNNDDLTGMVPDMMAVVGKMLDLKIEFVEMAALGQNVEELKRGVYDTFCIDSYYVFSMGKFVDFGTPYAYFPMFIYMRADDQRFKALADLNDPSVTFVGIDGDLSVTLAGHRFPRAKLNTLAATSDASTMTVNVATRKADVAIIDPGLAATYNAHNPTKLRALDPTHPVAVYPVGFSVAKGEDKLLRMLDSAVSAMINTGMMEPILARYRETGGAVWPVAPGYVPTPVK